MSEQKKKSGLELDKDMIDMLEKVIDEVGDTTKSVCRKIADLFVKKGSETLSGILEENKVILKEKIKSKGKPDAKEDKCPPSAT